MQLPIKRFDKTFSLPAYTPGAACFDYFCSETVTVEPGKIKPVKQNVAIQIPDGYAILIFARSSTALRKGLMLSNNVAAIDPKYSGDNDEHLVFVHNFTDKPVTVEAGDRIAQGMLIKTEPVDWQEVPSFGSTGHNGYQHLDDLK